ncbi:DUF3039 domain-containing protein [Cellulosimicrobium funkei]|nr:DUF3039 domain-containing protein [Cellulosimicrobium funkei]
MSTTEPHREAPQVRPTLKALKILPDDEPLVAAAQHELERAKQATDLDTQRAILAGLRLGELKHPLLDDARTILEKGGVPDVHASSSKAASTKTARRTVHEVRARTGAAWRGAVVLEDGVWWLVFAERHDRFHSTSADFFKKGTWAPSELDKQLAAQDAVHLERRRWKIAALTALLDALRDAVAQTRPIEFALTAPAGGGACTLRVEIEHDAPAPTADLAHTSSGILQTSLLVRGAGRDLVEAIVEILACVCDGEQDQSYLPGGDLLFLSTISHARLAQLTATISATTDIAVHVKELPAPTVLHYVNTGRLTAGFVTGTAVLSLCGEWFVPRLDSSADLPVCPTCEEHEPVARALLEHLRS